MKLYITRDQSSGMMGGISFELRARVELATGDAMLVKKYKADRFILLEKKIRVPITGQELAVRLTIGSLLEGQTFKGKDISEILQYEESVKESCRNFKNMLDVMADFGGEEVIEFE